MHSIIIVILLSQEMEIRLIIFQNLDLHKALLIMEIKIRKRKRELGYKRNSMDN